MKLQMSSLNLPYLPFYTKHCVAFNIKVLLALLVESAYRKIRAVPTKVDTCGIGDLVEMAETMDF